MVKKLLFIILSLILASSAYGFMQPTIPGLDRAVSVRDWSSNKVVYDATGLVVSNDSFVTNDLGEVILTFLSPVSASSTYVPYTGATTAVDLGAQTLTTTGYIKGEIRVISADADPDTIAEIAFDHAVSECVGGAMKWFDGNSAVRLLVDLGAAPTGDNEVVAYSSGRDKFFMKADAGGAEADTLDTVCTRGDNTTQNIRTSAVMTADTIVAISHLTTPTSDAFTLLTDGEIGMNLSEDALIVYSAKEYSIPLKHLAFGWWDLASVWDLDAEFPLAPLRKSRYPNGIVITSITVDCSVADPTTELDANLKYSDLITTDVFPASGTLIDQLNTSTGNFAINDMSGSDLGSGVIPYESLMFIDVETDPADANTFWMVTIEFYIPEN